MLLAGDIGGTKTLLGLFESRDGRPEPVETCSYPTREFESFVAIIDAFARDIGRPLRTAAAAFGVAGPVIGRRAKLTNIEWDIDGDTLARRLDGPVGILNDLEAMATGVPVLAGDELAPLQEGRRDPDGNVVVIAAGTGLGQAYLHRVNTTWRPVASEGGHADFAARTDRELELVRMLREQYGRAEVEQVLSGPGLLNLHRFTHRGSGCPAVEDLSDEEAPARVSQAALAGRCQFCVEALRMFVDAYGAETGNLALRGVATGGVFIGGGIAPKILDALTNGSFMRAFGAKPPMADLLARMPVHVILNPDAGLIGAAVRARDIAGNAQDAARSISRG